MSSHLFGADQNMVTVEVIPLTHEVLAGESFEIAAVFSMKPEWHIYWDNPGEAGIPTSFEWKLPPGFTIVASYEPVPSRHVDGGITTFIHENEAIYLFRVLAPGSIPDTSTFSVQIDWLECKSVCQAGASQHHFSLPQKVAAPTLENLKSRAMSNYPQAMPAGSWKAQLKRDRVELRNQISQEKGTELIKVDFFPYTEMVYNTGTAVRIKSRFRHDTILIDLLKTRDKDPESLHGVLVQHYASPEGVTIVNSIINENIIP